MIRKLFNDVRKADIDILHYYSNALMCPDLDGMEMY